MCVRQRSFIPRLRLLYPASLRDATVVYLYSSPHRLRLVSFLRVHGEVVRGPVSDLAVFQRLRSERLRHQGRVSEVKAKVLTMAKY